MRASGRLSPLSAPALNETVYFGGTTWAPDSMRWEAIKDSVWTFETGVGSAIKEPGHTYPWVDPYKPDGFHATMEGWTGLDHTRDPGVVQYFRRLSAIDPRWESNHVCVSSLAGLGGGYSFWAGVFPVEAAALCYVQGQGYGNHWNICLGHSFEYPGGAQTVTLEYDYENETEDGYDSTTVRTEWSGSSHEVVSYTGSSSGHEALALNPGTELPSGSGTITVTFCVTSDRTGSDEDGAFPTNCGAFAVDNIALSGGISYFTDFETDDGGWTVVPSGPGAGDWSRLVSLDDLPAISGGVEGACSLADSVLVMFDPGSQGHPPFQENVVVSPWIDLARAGEVGHPGKQIQLNGYFDLPLTNYIFMYNEAQWYPDSCGTAPRISRWTWSGYAYWHDPAPTCLDWDNSAYSTYSSIIPDYAEQVRIAVGTIDWCSFYGNCSGLSNTTPWIDNVRFAVFDMITIQTLIDAAAPGDTLRIPPGTYTGTGDRDLDFGGKNLVLLGTGGAGATIIDCKQQGRGFVFRSGEDSTSVVQGFTIRNGLAPPDSEGTSHGGAVWITGDSHPTFQDCVLESCTADLGGGMAVDSGSGPKIMGCTFDSNTAVGSGGGLWSSGLVDADQCIFQNNQAGSGGGGAWVGGTIGNSTVTGNHAAAGGGLYSFGLVHDCVISDNVAEGGEGGGVVCRQGQVFDCTVTGNQAVDAGGMDVAEGTATGCTVTGNVATGQGGGLRVGGGLAMDCIVSGNTADTGGGIVSIVGYHLLSSRLAGVLVTGNEASHGGGLALVNQDILEEVQVDSCTISGNHAAVGGGMHLDARERVRATRTIVWGNEADSSGSTVWMDTDALGTIFACCALDSLGIAGSDSVTYNGPQVFSNPLFCGPALWTAAPTTSGDYTLTGASPCLPANNLCGVLIGARDQGCATVGVGEDPTGPKPPGLAAYPNPFTGSLHLSFTGPAGATGARVEIFDVRGRLVWARDVPESTGELDWNGRDGSGGRAAPGVYFVHVRSGAMNRSARVVLIR